MAGWDSTCGFVKMWQGFWPAPRRRWPRRGGERLPSIQIGQTPTSRGLPTHCVSWPSLLASLHLAYLAVRRPGAPPHVRDRAAVVGCQVGSEMRSCVERQAGPQRGDVCLGYCARLRRIAGTPRHTSPRWGSKSKKRWHIARKRRTFRHLCRLVLRGIDWMPPQVAEASGFCGAARHRDAGRQERIHVTDQPEL